MEEEDDDFYGNAPIGQDEDDVPMYEPSNVAGDVPNDEDDEDSDDDEIEITLEKPEGNKEESAKPPRNQTTSIEPTADRVSRPPPSTRQESQRPVSTAPSNATKAPPTYNGKEGKDFPEVRTSKIDLNAIPTWPGTGKPITDIDIDADLAEHSKPWRQPGVDQTDFFNYGFDEYTWAQYCVRQQTMSNSISEAKQADAQMKAFLGGGGGGGGGGSGGGGPAGGMPTMPGMPDMDPQMAQMMQQMAASGGGMPDFNQFMQMMGGGGGGGGPGGFGGGFGPNTGSPHPQPGQGFPAPGGPGGGMPENMDGYSAQQIGIMQQGGGMGNQGGGGGGRRGRGRGRGYY